MSMPSDKSPISRRFRGFLPVIVDVETAGFNSKTDALLEIAVVTLSMDDGGFITPKETHACHFIPFKGANLEPDALKFNGIDPYNPFRMAVEEKEGLDTIFKVLRKEVKESDCTRAILVGHNSFFDLQFLNAAIERNTIKRSPFHLFSSFDTATLGGLVYGQTVLARACQAANIAWDNNQAHSAIYDTERTAELFCKIVNRWQELIDFEQQMDNPLEEDDL